MSLTTYSTLSLEKRLVKLELWLQEIVKLVPKATTTIISLKFVFYGLNEYVWMKIVFLLPQTHIL